MIKLNPVNIQGTVQTYAVELTEKLCKPFCENASIQPVADVTYSVEYTKLVNATLYVKVKAQGVVTYVQKDGCACAPCSKVFTEYFTLAFEDTTPATVTKLVQEDGYIEPAYVNCYGVACGISVHNLITLSIA